MHFNHVRQGKTRQVFELTGCVKQTFCILSSEINIFAVTRYCEINILTYLGLKSTFFSLHVAWNEHFALSKVKSSSLLSYVNVKSTFYPIYLGLKSTFLSLHAAWNELHSFFKWNQHLCCHMLPWNQHLNLSRPAIDAFELKRCVKWTFRSFISENNIFAVTR